MPQMRQRPNDLAWDDHLMRETREQVQSAVAGWDHDRLLVVMALGRQSEPKARASIPNILEQAEGCGLKVDMVLGLNNGAELPRLREDLDANAESDIQDLHTAASWAGIYGEDRMRAITRVREDYLIRDARRSVHRILCVHQLPEPGGAGKNKMLKAVADVSLRSMLEGAWQHPPALTLDMDDDGHLFVEGHPFANPLADLLEEKRLRCWNSIGSRMHTVPFEERDGLSLPRIFAPAHAAYEYLDQAQSGWHPFMPGCASLGATDGFLAARQIIGHRYPGSLCDDVHRTVLLARQTVPWGVSSRVSSTNERREGDVNQLIRWMRGTLALNKAFGKGACLTDPANAGRLHIMPDALTDIIRTIFERKMDLSLDGQSTWDK
jgi:hypothetical protein